MGQPDQMLTVNKETVMNKDVTMRNKKMQKKGENIKSKSEKIVN